MGLSQISEWFEDVCYPPLYGGWPPSPPLPWLLTCWPLSVAGVMPLWAIPPTFSRSCGLCWWRCGGWKDMRKPPDIAPGVVPVLAY